MALENEDVSDYHDSCGKNIIKLLRLLLFIYESLYSLVRGMARVTFKIYISQ